MTQVSKACRMIVTQATRCRLVPTSPENRFGVAVLLVAASEPHGFLVDWLRDPLVVWRRLGHWLASVGGWLVDAPLLAVLLAVALGCVLGWWVSARRRVFSSAVAGARFVEVKSPAVVDPESGPALWRLLGRRLLPVWLRAPGRVLSFEVHAGSGVVRPGWWVPAGMSAAQVAGVVEAACSGARARVSDQGHAPTVAGREGDAVVGVGLRLPGSALLPLADPVGPGRSDADGLRAVFDALVRLPLPYRGCVQVLTRAPSKRAVRRVRRMVSASAGQYHAPLLVRLARGVMDELLPGHSAPPASAAPRRPVDPIAAHRLRAAAGKATSGELVDAALRIVVTGPNRAYARSLAHEIAAGFDLAATQQTLRCYRMWRPLDAATRRRGGFGVRGGGWFLVSLGELAALAHLPYEPARYNLPVSGARQLAPPLGVALRPLTPEHRSGAHRTTDSAW